MSIKLENPTPKMEEDDRGDSYQISEDDDFFDDDPSLQDDEEMASTSKGNSEGDSCSFMRGPYEKAWTGDATRALIHLRGPMEDKFNEGRQKRTTLWLYVTKQLHRLGFRYSAAKVQKKWHNILITYNKNISKKEEAGYVHWEFFEDMYKYLKGRRAVYDQRQISSSSNDFQMKQHQQQLMQHRLQQQQRLQQRLQQQQLQHNNDDPTSTSRTENKSSIINVKCETPDASNSNGVHSIDDPLDDDDDEDPLDRKDFHAGNLPLQISHVVGGDGEETNTFGRNNSIKNLPNDFVCDTTWWKNHFEKKLFAEREKLRLQKDMHKELMNFNRTALMQQEKIERIKIDAINSLTSTLQKLVESKYNANSIRK